MVKTILTNGLFKSLDEALQHWMQAKVHFTIEGRPNEAGPEYLSALLRVLSTDTLEVINGIPSKEIVSGRKDSLRLSAYVGRDEKGSGRDISGHDDVPLNPRLLVAFVDEQMDDLVKTGTKNYLDGIGEGILDPADSSLILDGTSEKTVYHSPLRFSSKSISVFEPCLVEVSRYLSSLSGIREVSIRLRREQEQSLFVDSKSSDIRQRKETMFVIMELEGENDEGKKIVNIDGSVFSQQHYPLLRKRLDEMAAEWKEDFAGRKKVTKSVYSDSYPLLLDGTAAGVFIHEALVAHLLSGKAVLDNESLVFSVSRLETKILPEFLTIIDDPTLEGGVASYEYDDEGIKSERVVLVEKGRLKSYLLDKESAAKLGRKLKSPFKSNGHSRSSWSTNEYEATAPEPRVTNLMVQSEELLPEAELWERFLKQIRGSENGQGLYISSKEGEVYVKDGNFNLSPARVWLVDAKGERKIVTGIRIVGDANAMMKAIMATGLPYKYDYGYCGASSGRVSTQEYSPAMLLSQTTAIEQRPDTSTKRLLDRLAR